MIAGSDPRRQELTFAQRIIILHEALEAAAVRHAFGGALALAWCTERARGTIDIDVNVFVGHHRADEALDALPEGVGIDDAARRALAADGQTRLWWDHVPVDLFFNTTPFHDDAVRRVRHETFAGHRLPFLSCRDIAVFKVFFDRTQDWADLERMAEAGTLDVAAVSTAIIDYLGTDDHRLKRLRQLA